MLYVTTRSNAEIYTANRALRENRAPDGGLYIPYRPPHYSREAVLVLGEKPFSQCVAEILNRLFRTHLTGWDIDFCIGRFPVRYVSMSHRIIIAECWHDPGWTMDWMVERLTGLLCGKTGAETAAGAWPDVAVRIGILFGIFGELIKRGEVSPEEPVDVAVTSGDLSGAMAAVYGREWGLPIANVVICCNENAALWDLLSRGEMKTGAVALHTATPLCDQVIPRNLERMLSFAGGIQEVTRFLEAWETGRMYTPGPMAYSRLRQMGYVSVVSEKRMLSAIPNLYRMGQYIAGPYTALCHSGLQDYRARTGESRPAIVLSQRGAVRDAETVASAMGISVEALSTRINNG